MKESVDVSAEFRRELSNIDYTSPVCKINVALDRLMVEIYSTVMCSIF